MPKGNKVSFKYKSNSLKKDFRSLEEISLNNMLLSVQFAPGSGAGTHLCSK